MNESTLSIKQLADMLRQDARDLEKMASRGYLPARRVGESGRLPRLKSMNGWKSAFPIIQTTN